VKNGPIPSTKEHSRIRMGLRPRNSISCRSSAKACCVKSKRQRQVYPNTPRYPCAEPRNFSNDVVQSIQDSSVIARDRLSVCGDTLVRHLLDQTRSPARHYWYTIQVTTPIKCIQLYCNTSGDYHGRRNGQGIKVTDVTLMRYSS
jgi:hypothetical protein